eukprot:TRINITY_DN18052_c0_g1_i1.p1 TRINITY_DN18052_c0_g1~~TRINITY_DN18052_c0_g1_i1.p1  ORF type:complete len:340 (+),score=95.59 TRINITY_DN18052_c0_g1_i1:92-1111(+)
MALAGPTPIFPISAFLREALQTGDAGDSQRTTPLLPRIRVVDVGAMSLGDGDDVWTPLRSVGLVESVVGFEPVQEECDKLNAMHAASSQTSATQLLLQPAVGGAEASSSSSASAAPSTSAGCTMRFLPYALGDGSNGQFRTCSAPMTSSMLEPNIPLLRRFVQLEEVTTVVGRSEVQTHRLDDLAEDLGSRVDFLKLDVQGFELSVLKGAEKLLQSVLVLHTEVEFVELYEKQPLFAEVDQYMRQRGFVFHRFASVHGRPLKPLHLLANPLQPISQQLWADAVYVRDMWELSRHSADDLLRLACIMHEVYHSYDLVHHILSKLPDSGALAEKYLQTVKK